MNRTLRRQLARGIAKVAPDLAKSCLDYEHGTIAGTLAIAAVTRAIVRHATLGIPSDPTVLELTQSELDDFPAESDPIEGARHWLAVGIAIDGRVAWATQSIAFTGITDPVEHKLNAISIMSLKLQPELERDGMLRGVSP